MKQYGILAYPVKHSLSPVIHNAAFRELGIDAQYGVFERKADELEDFMHSVKEKGISGLSVSLPHKQNVMKYLDRVDDAAQKIGAVNTVVNESGVLSGFNTDWIGSNNALIEAVGDLKDKTVTILGAGGSARAVAYGCLYAGAHVWIKNRTKEKSDAIAVEFAELFNTEIHSAELEDMKAADILINTTSCWLDDSEDWQGTAIAAYVDSDHLANYDAVMDIVYKPLITPLLWMALDAKVEIINGARMLLYQACEQFELWTGKKAPVEVMQDVLQKNLSES